MQYREADSEKSKTCLKLPKDPNENVRKEEMQKGDNLDRGHLKTLENLQVPRKCYETVKMSREQRPKERCNLKPRRICRGQGCR